MEGRERRARLRMLAVWAVIGVAAAGAAFAVGVLVAVVFG